MREARTAAITVTHTRPLCSVQSNSCKNCPSTEWQCWNKRYTQHKAFQHLHQPPFPAPPALPCAANQLLKLPTNKFTVREREMLIGSRVLPPEFFQAASNPFVVGVSVCECRGGGQRVGGEQANSVLGVPAILGGGVCEGLVRRGEFGAEEYVKTQE